MLTPVGTAMLFRAFPPSERARAASVLMIPAVLAPAFGPVVGGWLVTDVSWRWIFYVNLPVGVFGFIFGALFLKESREPSAGRSMLPASPVLLTAITGISMFVLLVIVELRLSQPMLDLRLYRERMFRSVTRTSCKPSASAAWPACSSCCRSSCRIFAASRPCSRGLATFPQAIGMMPTIRRVGRL